MRVACFLKKHVFFLRRPTVPFFYMCYKICDCRRIKNSMRFMQPISVSTSEFHTPLQDRIPKCDSVYPDAERKENFVKAMASSICPSTITSLSEKKKVPLIALDLQNVLSELLFSDALVACKVIQQFLVIKGRQEEKQKEHSVANDGEESLQLSIESTK